MRFNAFGYGQAQNMAALLDMATAAGIVDVRVLRQRLDDYLRLERLTARQRSASARKVGKVRQISRAAGRCSVCNAPAVIERVNVCPSTNIGGPWLASISCTNPTCLHVELSEREVRELANGG
jgi:hypothetical protein